MILHWFDFTLIRTGSDWWFSEILRIRTGSDSILSDQDWTRTEKFHSLLISARRYTGLMRLKNFLKSHGAAGTR